jgi:20S proteasome subunit alpha 5
VHSYYCTVGRGNEKGGQFWLVRFSIPQTQQSTLLLAGYDELEGGQLYFSDPSGIFLRYKAKAIGAGSEGAQLNLEESYSESMTLEEEAEVLALSTLKQVMEEKISTDNIELARVTPKKGFHIKTAAEVGTVLERLTS